MDTKGDETDWSAPLVVSMPMGRSNIYDIFIQIFERFPNAFPLIRIILGL